MDLANRDIRMQMIEHGIKNADLAKGMKRDRTTLWRWLKNPDLDPARKAAILDAINKCIDQEGGR